MRGAPQSGFSRLMVRINWRTSLGTPGRPRWPRAIFHFQKSRKPRRCQAMTVSGDDNERGTPVAPDSAQPGPQEPIRHSQFRLLHRPTQNTELVTKSDVLLFKGGSRFKGCRGDRSHQVNGTERKGKATTEGKKAPYSHVVRILRQAGFR